MKILNISIPIIQAPMAGGATTPALVAAVSNAGGLGSLAGGYVTPDSLRKSIQETRALTSATFSVNLFVPNSPHYNASKVTAMNQILQPYCQLLQVSARDEKPTLTGFDQVFREQIQVILEEKVPIVSFTFGFPDEKILNLLKTARVVVMGTATSVNEAIDLEQRGCDVIVAQGSEAGGHRGTYLDQTNLPLIGTIALIPQVVDEVSVPVVAAGGIMDNRGVRAALMLGASAVQLGTAFLTCHESGISDAYKNALINSTEESTVLTRVFSGKFARGIRNRFIDEMEKHHDSICEFPVQNELTQGLRKAATQQNNTDLMSLWAGQGTRMSVRRSAKELIEKLLS